jgi:hypothetical protein
VDGEALAQARALWARMDDAQRYPTGTWKQRLLPGWTRWGCKHETVRCIHGDEIIARNFRRRLCMVCGRALKGRLPLRCWFSGRLHPATELRVDD